MSNTRFAYENQENKANNAFIGFWHKDSLEQPTAKTYGSSVNPPHP